MNVFEGHIEKTSGCFHMPIQFNKEIRLLSIDTKKLKRKMFLTSFYFSWSKHSFRTNKIMRHKAYEKVVLSKSNYF